MCGGAARTLLRCAARARLRSVRCLLVCVLACLLVALNALFLTTLLLTPAKPRFSHDYAKLSGTVALTRLAGNWSVPSLMELDVVRLAAAVIPPQSLPQSTRCPEYRGPVPSPTEVRGQPQSFLHVENGMRDAFVFSAYYDPRTSPPLVRVIGLSGGYSAQPQLPVKHCQLWYRGGAGGKSAGGNERGPVVTRAQYDIVPETHGRRYQTK